jgi:hypothetical protein
MPSALRLLAAVLQQLSAGDLNNIDALLGCPLAMPDARMFTDGRCAAACTPYIVIGSCWRWCYNASQVNLDH